MSEDDADNEEKEDREREEQRSRGEKGEERAIQVINPFLLTGVSHFSTPCLAICGATQWNATHCVPERPLHQSPQCLRKAVSVCVCVCKRDSESRHESTFPSRCLFIFCFPKYRPICLCYHTHAHSYRDA